MKKKRKSCHTSVTKGKRVRIVTRNGDVIIDKFVDKKGRFIVLENHKLTTAEVINMSIYKPQPPREKNG